MNSLLRGVACAAIALALAGAAAATRAHADQALAQAGRRAATIPLPAGARVERDIAYGRDPAQRMDVYLPPNAEGAPVLFMVHGGAWMLGDKTAANVVANKVAHWLPRGFIFITINNRLLPAADPLQQADDVAAALAFAQSRARSWGGDPARFVVMGHSAGAHLVALLAADPQIAAHAGARPWLGTVALDSAALDVVQIMQAPHPRLYDRAFGRNPDFWRSASPAYRLSGTPAPTLLVCSSRRADSCRQAQRFADRIAAAGGRTSVLPLAMSHAEINADLGLAGDYTQSVDAFMRAIGAT